MDLQAVQLDRKIIRKSSNRIKDNDLIAGYYERMNAETDNPAYCTRAEAVKGCFKLWDIDYYRKQKVKDILRINLCRDKFCLNCQAMLALRRQAKYKPELDRLEKKYDIYHVVFTVPNVDGEELTGTLKHMYLKFPYVVQYFQGKRKAKGVDFSRYGFAGAVRSLEITTKREYGQAEYHPHFHCLFLLRKGLSLEKRYINNYSFSGNRSRPRKFTGLEILLQKIWYFFLNDGKLTVSALDSLTEGYSVTADKSNGNYHEVFKYACKGAFKDGAIYDYEVFKTLYHALYRRKIIQGYGLLNKFDFDDDIDAEEVEAIYIDIITQLRRVEGPERQHVLLKKILSDLEAETEIKYISRNLIRAALAKKE